MEVLLLGALAGMLLAPSGPQKTISTPPTMTTTPHTAISHLTNTDGEGMNNVYNVSFVNNNHIPAPPPPPSTYESAQQYLRKTFKSLHLSDLASATYEYCCENKYYIAFFTIAGSYGYLFYKLRAIQAYAENPSLWSSWKRDIPFDQLLAIPQDHLTHELMVAIQEHYISAENPTDSLTPLITFSTDIAEEKALLTEYHSYVSWSMKFSLQKVISFSQNLLVQLAERKQRVTYLSNLFQSWLAHYKLEQVKHSRSIVEIPKQ